MAQAFSKLNSLKIKSALINYVLIIHLFTKLYHNKEKSLNKYNLYLILLFLLLFIINFKGSFDGIAGLGLTMAED